MNILVLSHIYPKPDDPSDGIFVHRQVKQLQLSGHNVTVLSPLPWAPRSLHFNPRWRSYGQTPASTTCEGIPVYYPRYLRLPGAWFRSISGFMAYRGLLPLALKLHGAEPFDIIHSHFMLPNGLAGLYLGRRLKLPTVCSVRGSDALIHPYDNYLNNYYSRMVVTRTAQMVAVSRALRTAVETLAKPSKPICVVYNGVNLEKFSGSRQPLGGAQLGMALGKAHLLFVGHQIYVKGLKDLLVAFSRVMDELDCYLVVVGPTLNDVTKMDPELVKRLGDRLIVKGRVSPDEIPAYMQHCDILVLPSYSEGLPNVLLEAMACAKPVITTDIMGMPEVVTHGSNGLLIKPGDRLGLSEAIRSLLKDPQLCQRMGKLGQESVIRKFTWERNAADTIAIYQDLLSAGIPVLRQG